MLPKLRGAAPVNWSIINGDTMTGITTMFSDLGVDTGNMLLKRELAIGADMDAESLANSMSLVGADLLKETLKKLMDGNLLPEVQNNDEATFAPRLTKDMGNIDWNKSAREIHNLVRGLYSWPGTYSHLESQQVKILSTRITGSAASTVSEQEAGTVIKCTGQFIVACGEGGKEAIEIVDVKPANKGKMSAVSWANGLRLKPGCKMVSS